VLEIRNKGGTRKTGPDRRSRVGRPVRSDRPRGADGGSPRFFPGTCLCDFLLWSENFKGSLKKENAVSRAFLFGLFNWPNWELRNPSHLAFSCTHTAAMMSPKSVELKQAAEEPSMEEAKRCELKLPVEIKRTACIHCGGCVPTGEIASRNPSRRRRSLLPFEGRRASEA
jgi:RNase P subunit RPR2